MRYQVPQFIDVEDKIIGPFTLKQFLIYLGAVLGLIPVYLLSDLSLFITVAIPILGIAVMFAHLKINGKTLFATLLNAAGFYSGGQLSIWRREGQTKPLKIVDPAWQEAIQLTQPPAPRPSSLTHMAQALETQGNVVKAEPVADILSRDS